jgi:hypothetical protein
MYKILISTFGKRPLKLKKGVPIEVGAALRENFKYPLHDDTGDNISQENPYYGELTGLYWIWKNVKFSRDDIIGFCHYNKCLRITESKAKRWLSVHNNGIITLPPSKIRNHPVPKECNAVFEVLKQGDEKYYNACKKLYDDEFASKYENCRGGNMMICHGDTFKSYCSWLFPILIKVREIVGDKPEADAYWKRYCAYMGERLLSVYIEANKLPVLGVEERLKKWWIKPLGKIRKLLGIDRNNPIFRFIYKKIGYKSSYK